ncbi:MAG: helix-turn-helix domain-containing protein [Pseudomonas indica]|nr:helix-turn-helix transcriptional regulator [Pseudomonas indica]MBU3057450.1 helix-turn-helix domain-containing protein [Pseudomonas indica]PAU52258.1 transcriptional regulator [Pseudomonas indica]
MKNSPLAIAFGQRIRDLRTAHGLSQEAFADLSGFDRTYISGIELGKRNPSLLAIEALAKALGVTAGELFSGL